MIGRIVRTTLVVILGIGFLIPCSGMTLADECASKSIETTEEEVFIYTAQGLNPQEVTVLDNNKISSENLTELIAGTNGAGMDAGTSIIVALLVLYFIGGALRSK